MNPWFETMLAEISIEHDGLCVEGAECKTRDQHIERAYLPGALRARVEQLQAEIQHFEDDDLRAWQRIAEHPALRPCYAADGPLLDAVLERLTVLSQDHAKARAQGMRDFADYVEGSWFDAAHSGVWGRFMFGVFSPAFRVIVEKARAHATSIEKGADRA